MAASRSIWRFRLSGSCLRADCGSIGLLVRTGRGSSRTLSGGLAWSLRTFWHRHIVAHLFVLWPGDRYSDLRKFKEIIFLTLYISFIFHHLSAWLSFLNHLTLLSRKRNYTFFDFDYVTATYRIFKFSRIF